MTRYFLSICAIVRHEAPYFLEWAAFHLLQGVDHFFIYHNRHGNDDKETMDVIAADAEKNKDISYIPWFGEKQQCRAYQHCLDTEEQNSEWIAFIDVDEFLWNADPRTTWEDELEVLIGKPDVAAIAVHWYLFGSNNQKEKTDGLVIERFTKRADLPDNHVKSICRPRYIESCASNPHAFIAKEGYRIIDERGVELPRQYANSTTGTADILRINHMHTKSYQEYVDRKSGAPDANSGVRYSKEQIDIMFAGHDVNEVEDTIVKDLYAEKVKACLK